VNTIERELESALHRVGCISNDNHESIAKIGWSRSSRTDKGVHAARLLISAKLLLPPNYPEGVEAVISEINRKLPEDIRLFSIVKVNQGFCARKSCNWRSDLSLSLSSTADLYLREYEYHLPLNHLAAQVKNDQTFQPTEVIRRLNEALQLMQGSQGSVAFAQRLSLILF
jgi:tRNA pseudouridine38-40 synthase